MGFWIKEDYRHMVLDATGNYYTGTDSKGNEVTVRAEDFERKRYRNTLARNVAWWQMYYPELIVQNGEE